MTTTPVRNATQLLDLFEELCGWDCYTEAPDVPGWKRKAIEAGKINKKVAKDPDGLTWEVLTRTVEYCRRHRIEVTAPMGLFYYVADAKREHRETEKVRAAQTDDMIYKRALAREQEMAALGEAAARDWVTRMIRAQGPGREEVLAEWRAAGRE